MTSHLHSSARWRSHYLQRQHLEGLTFRENPEILVVRDTISLALTEPDARICLDSVVWFHDPLQNHMILGNGCSCTESF